MAWPRNKKDGGAGTTLPVWRTCDHVWEQTVGPLLEDGTFGKQDRCVLCGVIKWLRLHSRRNLYG